jgi:hypothetical protein
MLALHRPFGDFRHVPVSKLRAMSFGSGASLTTERRCQIKKTAA